MQDEEEPEQRIEKLKEYAQQAHNQVGKIKAEHEAQIAELKLRLRPETPPHVREQRLNDIKASAQKIYDLVGSASKLLEESVEIWEKLQKIPEVEKLQDLIKQRQTELEHVKQR